MRSPCVVLTLILLPVMQAFADPVALDWMDRVTHEVQQEDGPLSDKPLQWHVYGGVFGYYTDNVFLTPNRFRKDDYVAVPFLRGRVDYQDARWETAADLLLSYDAYYDTYAPRNDQEHFYGKLRFVDGILDAQLVEVARHESDPVDAVFTEHAGRWVTDTLPRVGIKIKELIRLEAFANIETVHFEGRRFNALENENYRAGASALVEVTENFSLGASGGYLRISYRESDVTPNADGWFAQALVRGEPVEQLLVEAGLGYSRIHPFHRQPGTDERNSGQGFDAELHVRYRAAESLLLQADYTRHFGFAGGTSSYQTLDRVLAFVEWEPVEKLKVKLRGQADRVRPSNSAIRTYMSAGFDVGYQFSPNFAVSGGATARVGNTHKVTNDNYDNWIVFLGLIFSY